MTKWEIDWETLMIVKKENKKTCTGCGAILNCLKDFIVHSYEHNVTLCRDCYDFPVWYELINQ